LYSTPNQVFSTDNAVQYLISIGIPRNKLVVGAAFYARVWENVPATNNGLYQPGKFKNSVGYSRFPQAFSAKDGFVKFWDSTAKAPYMYNAEKKLFVTYDDEESLRAKTQYAADQQLSGIMFWQLTHDIRRNGLLDAIQSVIRK
jgi:chitinase